jgi:hypothetical protein
MTADPETPSIIDRLLQATEDEDFDAFAACFLPDGVVLDEGKTYVGRDEIVAWRQSVADGPAFTAEVTAKGPLGPSGDGYQVTEHLEGDFPGGVVDLDFVFALKGDRIAALMILPRRAES